MKVQESDTCGKLVFFISTFQEQIKWTAPDIQNKNFSASGRIWEVL